MQTPRTTRSSTLGKRNRQLDSPAATACEQLLTPEPTPTLKRARTSSTTLVGDHNKENIPPYSLDSLVPSRARSLRRNSTEANISPTRPRAANLTRHASISVVIPSTPTREISDLRLQTPPPTPPTIIAPTHVRVKALLRSTSNIGGDMPGRSKECNIITSFLNEADGCADAAMALYISGSPGTGKTALVHSVLDGMDLEARGVRAVVINCMALNNLDALRDRLVEEFGSKAMKARKFKSKRTIESLFSNMEGKVVLVLDELDNIVPSIQTISDLFECASSKLRIIGIANTHTLSSNAQTHQSIVAGVQTMHFAPYAPTELLEILKTRLAPLKEQRAASVDRLLPGPALMLLTKKIAAMTGDVRSLFEVLRGAIDLAAAACSGLEGQTPSVTPAHILAALKAHSPSARSKTASSSASSETVSKVRELGLQARLVLLAVVLAIARLDAGLCMLGSAGDSMRLDANSLHRYYGNLLAKSASGAFTAVSRSELGDLLSMLEGVGLTTLATLSSTSSSPTKGPRKGLGRSVSFGGVAATKNAVNAEIKLASGVWADEIVRGLGIGSAEEQKDVMEEEIQVLYEQEKARLSKDVQAEKRKNSKSGATAFEDAIED